MTIKNMQLKAILEKTTAMNLFLFIAVFTFIGVILFKLYIPLGGNDFWMHAGHVRYFSENILNPVTNYDETGSINVRNFAPWQFLLANIKNVFELSTIETMQVGAVISTALIFMGLWLISGILSNSPFAPAALLITALFVIGTGFSWSEEIHIHSIFSNASYPSTVAVAISFFCFFFTNKYLLLPKLKYVIGIVFTVAFILLNHQMVFLHFMAFLFFWVMFMSLQWKQRFKIFGLFGIGILVSMLWPYFNPIEISYSAVTGADARWDGNFSGEKLRAIDTHRSVFFGSKNFITALGLAVSSYVLVFFIKSKIRWPLLVFALFCTVMWHFGRVLHLPTSGYRWAMPTIFALQFIFAHHLAFAFDKVVSLRPKFNKAYVFSCILVIVTGLVAINNLRSEMWTTLPWLESVDSNQYSATQELVELTDSMSLEDDDVVLADHRISYSLVGLDINPVIFSRKHNSVNVQLLEFYNNKLDIDQQHVLLKQLNAEFIIVDITDKPTELLLSIKSYAQQVAKQGRFVAYKLGGEVEN
jgi:hypothetical protein